MKRTIFVVATILVVFATLFAVLVLRPVPKAKANCYCSARLLNGNYGLTAFGGAGTSSATVFPPASAVGLVTFDGSSHVSAKYIYTAVGGSVIQSNQTASGTYTVGSDCKFSATVASLFGATVTFNGTVIDAEGGSAVTLDVQSSLNNITGTGRLDKVQGW